MPETTVKRFLNTMEFELKKEFNKFEFEKNNSYSLIDIKTMIITKMHEFVERGLLASNLPIVDINNQTEISYLLNMLDEINFEIEERIDAKLFDFGVLSDLTLEKAILIGKIESLETESSDPSEMFITFKDPETFKIWDFDAKPV